MTDVDTLDLDQNLLRLSGDMFANPHYWDNAGFELDDAYTDTLGMMVDPAPPAEMDAAVAPPHVIPEAFEAAPASPALSHAAPAFHSPAAADPASPHSTSSAQSTAPSSPAAGGSTSQDSGKEKRTRTKRRRVVEDQLSPQLAAVVEVDELLQMDTAQISRIGERLGRQLKPEELEELTRLRRMVRNRYSAKESRMRKREEQQKKEDAIGRLKKENEELRRENATLKENVRYLSGVIRENPHVPDSVLDRIGAALPSATTNPAFARMAGMCLFMFMFSFGLYFQFAATGGAPQFGPADPLFSAGAMAATGLVSQAPASHILKSVGSAPAQQVSRADAALVADSQGDMFPTAVAESARPLLLQKGRRESTHATPKPSVAQDMFLCANPMRIAAESGAGAATSKGFVDGDVVSFVVPSAVAAPSDASAALSEVRCRVEHVSPFLQ